MDPPVLINFTGGGGHPHASLVAVDCFTAGELVDLEDLEARIFQHEYDHMNGSDFTQRVSPLVLQRAKKKLVNNIKKNLRKYGNL